MNSKDSLRLLGLFSLLFTLMFLANLEAGGWGKRGTAVDEQGITWAKAFYEINDLHFEFTMPNFSGIELQNGVISATGSSPGTEYAVATAFNPQFASCGTLEENLEAMQNSMPDFQFVEVDAKKLGAKFAIEMIPVSAEVNVYNRFLFTETRLITMSTNDGDEFRRLYFFNSFFLY